MNWDQIIPAIFMIAVLILVLPSFLRSNSKLYLNKFIKNENKRKSDLIEIHNRPDYVNKLFDINENLVLYFHNNPLMISGSKSTSERLNLLKRCKYIFFNSKWTKNQFFKDLNENEFINNHGICYQSTKKTNVN